MIPMKTIAFGLVAITAACSQIGDDKSVDRGVNAHHLSTMVAGIWVDPNGCDHWIIDDGVEGYADARLTPDGVGPLAPVATNRTEEGRALNRRVELVERP